MSSWINELMLAIMALALLLTFLRLSRGPTLPDRVVALDLTALIISGMLLVAALSPGSLVLIDVAIVIAILGFLATVTYAFYIERRGT